VGAHRHEPNTQVTIRTDRLRTSRVDVVVRYLMNQLPYQPGDPRRDPWGAAVVRRGRLAGERRPLLHGLVPKVQRVSLIGGGRPEGMIMIQARILTKWRINNFGRMKANPCA
jgi:hypothetical protein